MQGLNKEFESSTVNEPSVFEPMRLYCIFTYTVDLQWLESLWDHGNCSRHGYYEPLSVNHNARSGSKWKYFRNVFSIFFTIMVC